MNPCAHLSTYWNRQLKWVCPISGIERNSTKSKIVFKLLHCWHDENPILIFGNAKCQIHPTYIVWRREDSFFFTLECTWFESFIYWIWLTAQRFKKYLALNKLYLSINFKNSKWSDDDDVEFVQRFNISNTIVDTVLMEWNPSISNSSSMTKWKSLWNLKL